VRDACRTDGTLYDPGDNCPAVAPEPFIANQLPPDTGFIRRVQVDTWTGLLASQWCQQHVEEQVFANITDSFVINWLNNTNEGRAYKQLVGLPADLKPAPTQECPQNVLPVVSIASPAPNQTIQSSQLTITGMVSGPNFANYQLLYAPAGTQNFQPVTDKINQQFTQNGSTLGTWNLTSIQTGQYTLRLQANSTTGGYIRTDVSVFIENIQPTPLPTPIPLPTSATGDGGTSPIPFDPLNPTATNTPPSP
jgi:hypothetical protein